MLILCLLALVSLALCSKGFYESRKNNPYGLTKFFYWMGIFVWADAVVFGAFWFLVSLSILFIIKSWLLFLLIVSVFYFVRSLGETIYWFNQQFSTINRNPPHTLRGYKLFKNDSIWFVYQIWWQCVTVISVITTIYFTVLWIRTIYSY